MCKSIMELKTIKVYKNDWKKLHEYKIKEDQKSFAEVIKNFIKKKKDENKKSL